MKSTDTTEKKPGAGAQNIEDIYPLTPVQQGLLFHCLLEPGLGFYWTQCCLVIEGDLKFDLFQKAWRQTIEENASLRTIFVWEKQDQPLQVVRRAIDLSWKTDDWSSASPQEQKTLLAKYLSEDRAAGPDLMRGPLLRMAMFRLGPQRHQFVWSCHHLLFDGWSLQLIINDVLETYDRLHAGSPSTARRRPQYRRHVEWMQRQNLDEARRFFTQHLEGAASPPMIHPQPGEEQASSAADRFGEARLSLPAAETAKLKEFARSHKVTLNTVMQTAWGLLLQRYSGESDVVFGVTFSGRSAPVQEIESIVGLFINTIPVRLKLESNQSVTQCLGATHQTHGALQQFQHTPLSEIQGWLKVPGGQSLFDSIFVFENYPVRPGWTTRPSGINISEVRSLERTNYPLTVVVEAEAEILIRLFHDRNQFSARAAGRILAHFRNVLSELVANPDGCIGELSILSPEEKQQMLMEWNCTEAAYPRNKCIHELFEQQVDRTPGAIAVVDGAKSITYSELDRKANRLANRLRDLGVGPDMFVGLCMERSLEMVIALLGILKAGGAYVPLDSRYPKDRLQYFMSDTDAKVLVSQRSLVDKLPLHSACLLLLDEQSTEFDRASDQRPAVRMGPESLAYVIYTSGSTGTPKGVSVPHRAVNRLVINTNYITLDSRDVVAQVSNASFDAATFEIWGALLNGSRLAIITTDIVLSPADFVKQLERNGVTAMFLTTALFNLLAVEVPGGLRSVRSVLFGGEEVDPHRVAETLQNGPPERLLHVYGPTETTTFATWHEIKGIPPGARTVPIGRPISNTTAYVLDSQLRPLPIGAPGELYIGGDGLARGYLKRPELTAEKFIHNPFGSGDVDRLYRTGDVVRYLENGDIEFIGRIDNQVKIRGFRIELGEIESHLAAHAAVRDSVVAARGGSGGNKTLVAYVVAQKDIVPSAADLRKHLAQRLPDYMIPSTFVFLDALPLTPNGKVDRKALPTPDSQAAVSLADYQAPKDEVELKLAEIWSEVLRIPKIGTHDNFFELGGHSLMAVQVIARIKKVFDRQLPLAALFEAPTIEKLADTLREGFQQTGPLLIPIQPNGSKPPIFWVHTLGGGGGGGLFRYKQLADLLGPDQPSFGIQAPPEPFTTIPEMAAAYIKLIRSRQPTGPYYLAGFCFGANAAFEMAQQLMRKNQQVAFLGLIEAWAQSKHPGEYRWNFQTFKILLRNIFYTVQSVLEQSPKQLWARIARRFQITMKYFSSSEDARLMELDEVMNLDDYPEEFRIYAKTHWTAASKYKPVPYPGHVSLFRVRRHGLFALDPTLGWGKLAGDRLTTNIVPGTHENLFDPPHVAFLARAFAQCLEAGRVRHQSLPSAQPARATARAQKSTAQNWEGPLTQDQKQVWLAEQIYPESLYYHLGAECPVEGTVDVELYRRALQATVNSSDALRTVILERDGVPIRRVLESMPLQVEFKDFSADSDPEASQKRWFREHFKTKFDLSRRLHDFRLAKLADKKFVLYGGFHHLVCDGISVGVFLATLSKMYRLAREGKLHDSEPMPLFEEYVRHEQEFLKSPRYRRIDAFWKDASAAWPEPIGFYGPHVARKSSRVHRVARKLGQAREARLRALSQGSDGRGNTLPNLFFTALAAYVHLASGRRCFVMGIPFHNRRSQAFKETIGFFSQPLPLHVEIGEGETYSSLAKKIRLGILEIGRHGPYTFQGSGRAQGFDAKLNFHLVFVDELAGMPMKFGWINPGHGVDSFAVQVHQFDPTGLRLDFDCHADVFSEQQAERAANDFLAVLDHFLENPDGQLMTSSAPLGAAR